MGQVIHVVELESAEAGQAGDGQGRVDVAVGQKQVPAILGGEWSGRQRVRHIMADKVKWLLATTLQTNKVEAIL
jgi:hypothetical protein